MKGSNVIKHQDMLARRREAEQMKIERTTAVNSYFDKWGRITTKYQNWTTPDYYQKVQQTVEQKRSEQQKSQQLELRQNALRKLLDDEKLTLELEAKEQKNGKTRKVVSAEVLEGIHNALLRSEEEKRRMELESKLYRKWRQGEDRVLLESKSNQEALAKMNWLDKQIELQLERDKEQRESMKISLERDREARKHLEFLQQRQNQREEELNKLKSFQNEHITELKSRSEDSDRITSEIARLTLNRTKLKRECSDLNETITKRSERIQYPFNTRRIKIILKQRSEAIRKDLRDDIDLLERIDAFSIDGRDRLHSFRSLLAQQSHTESQIQFQIDAMYESEAKMFLVKQEQIWTDEANARHSKLSGIMQEQLQAIELRIEQLRNNQRSLVEVKESHLLAIDNSNQRLKDLMIDQRSDENKVQQVVGRRSEEKVCETATASSSASNLSDAPKFGRKKIAWL